MPPSTPNEPQQLVYSPTEVATDLRMSVRTVVRHCHSGRIQAVLIGRRWKIPASERARLLSLPRPIGGGSA